MTATAALATFSPAHTAVASVPSARATPGRGTPAAPPGHTGQRHPKRHPAQSHTPSPATSPATSPVTSPVTQRPAQCLPDPGRVPLTHLWPQQQLEFQRAWPVSTGRHVLVAVIDSGLNPHHPQLRGADIRAGINVTVDPPDRDVTDCVNHGTEVASVIAAQQTRDSAFLGVAPDAQILPIKQSRTRNDKLGAVFLARAIRAAVAAGAQVANVSVTVNTPTPALVAAVRAADRAGMVIVAAVGNDQQTGNRPLYPAALSPDFSNVIAVSASDETDAVPPFPESGPYVDVAAPGIGYEVPAPGKGYAQVTGTSFAAPYVTGTVALMLGAQPVLTPAQVKRRLETTADPPPVAVPDPRYGYGVIDPFLAVTSVHADNRPPASATPGPPLPARAAPPPPDRHLQHLALGVGLGLLGLAALVVAGAAVVRGSRPARGSTARRRSPAGGGSASG